MQKIKLYISGENAVDVREIEIVENPSHADVIGHFKIEFDIPETGEPFHVHIEEDEVLPDGEEIILNADIIHLGRVTCHRCEKIKTTITYNSIVREFEFPPSATANKVIKTVHAEFGLSQEDVVGFILTAPDNRELGGADHIGSYIAFPNCAISFSLGPDLQVKG